MSRDESQIAFSKQGLDNFGKITTPSGKPLGMPQCEWDRIQAEKKRIKRPKVRKSLVRVKGQMVERGADEKGKAIHEDKDSDIPAHAEKDGE